MEKLNSVEKVTEGIKSLARSSFGLPPASATSTATGRLPPVTFSGGSSPPASSRKRVKDTGSFLCYVKVGIMSRT